MDEVDAAIVHHLRADGRQFSRALAERLGTAPFTCLERTGLLHKRGIIEGYGAQVSPARLPPRPVHRPARARRLPHLDHLPAPDQPRARPSADHRLSSGCIGSRTWRCDLSW
ncbi:Lrp/AsnC family transcriptional regulator [Streptomyces sp. NPDC052415]|uniref:Lrp/AsnC family transcriptional regulator n=1 Tax=Streptomyces sp. NPDC052415 TaxID=3365690 RepID=UPI0037D70FC1